MNTNNFKKVNIMGRAILSGALLFAFLIPVCLRAKTIKIVSDGTWTVYDTSGNALGLAKNVCLNQNAPSPCPAGAILYGNAGKGWAADLSSIPGATWIWAPNVSGTTANSNNAEFIFRRPFQLCGNPIRGTIYLAVDNFAEVRLNGKLILSSSDNARLTGISISASDLRQGPNMIEVRAKNKDYCPSGEYWCNPAGMVFGAFFEDDLNVYPKCTGDIEANQVKTEEIINNGQKCTQVSLCQCFGSTYAAWLPIPPICPPQPPTCTGANGRIFPSGQSETLSCPAGQSGSITRTCQNGNWQVTSNTCKASPPVTCVGVNGAAFLPGQSEAVPCGCEGTQTRTCQSNGSWWTTSGCIIPLAKAGELCGSKEKRECRTCPPGTTCKPRRTRVCDGWWIFKHCYWIETTDWYCDPD